MAGRTQKRGGDVTGRNADALAEQNKAALAARADELSMFAASQRVIDEEPVDLTAGPPPSTPAQEEIDAADAAARFNEENKSRGVEQVPDSELEVREVDVAEKIVQFRVNEDLEQVTIGQGNNYDFIEGKTYRAPQFVYDHLEEKGYVWH